jgi:hypothetical protein
MKSALMEYIKYHSYSTSLNTAWLNLGLVLSQPNFTRGEFHTRTYGWLTYLLPACYKNRTEI